MISHLNTLIILVITKTNLILQLTFGSAAFQLISFISVPNQKGFSILLSLQLDFSIHDQAKAQMAWKPNIVSFVP